MMRSPAQPDILEKRIRGFRGLRLRRTPNQKGHHCILESSEFGQQVVELENESDSFVPKSG
jgi:hypothetical protein